MFFRLLRGVWQRKIFVLYMCVLGAVLAFFIRYYAVEEKYVYSLNYYITNSELAKILVDTSSLETDSMMANSCRIILKSDLTLETLGEMLVDKYGKEYLSNYFTIVEDEDKSYVDLQELSDCISIKNVSEGTAVLGVDITCENPYLCQDIGNILTFLAPNIVYYLVGVDYISPYENARLKTEYEFFGLKKTAASGVGAGLLLALAIILLYDRFYQKIIVDKSDIDKSFEIVTLGEIPYYNMKDSFAGKEIDLI